MTYVYLPAELEGDPVILSTNPVTAGLVLTLPPVLPELVFVPTKRGKVLGFSFVDKEN